MAQATPRWGMLATPSPGDQQSKASLGSVERVRSPGAANRRELLPVLRRVLRLASGICILLHQCIAACGGQVQACFARTFAVVCESFDSVKHVLPV